MNSQDCGGFQAGDVSVRQTCHIYAPIITIYTAIIGSINRLVKLLATVGIGVLQTGDAALPGLFSLAPISQ